MKPFYLGISLIILIVCWLYPEEKISIHELVTLLFIGVYNLIAFIHTDLSDKFKK